MIGNTQSTPHRGIDHFNDRVFFMKNRIELAIKEVNCII